MVKDELVCQECENTWRVRLQDDVLTKSSLISVRYKRILRHAKVTLYHKNYYNLLVSPDFNCDFLTLVPSL